MQMDLKNFEVLCVNIFVHFFQTIGTINLWNVLFMNISEMPNVTKC